MEKRKDCVRVYLSKLGYSVNGYALAIIEICDNWYSNRVVDDFHKRKNLNNVEYELNKMKKEGLIDFTKSKFQIL